MGRLPYFTELYLPRGVVVGSRRATEARYGPIAETK